MTAADTRPSGDRTSGAHDDELRAAIRIAASPAARSAARVPSAGWPAPDGDAEVQSLAEHLYAVWFTGSSGSAAARATTDGPPTLRARLRAAHVADRSFEDGWRVLGAPAGATLHVEREGVERVVVAPDYVNTVRPAVPPRRGDMVSVAARREIVDADNGWWLTTGSAGAAPTAPMVRVYWNCPAEAAPQLIRGVTGVLEAANEPYTMKCPLVPALFGRRDAVVTYLAPAGFVRLKPALRRLHRAMASTLIDAVPPLTLRLGRGAAAGEDPGDGRSYGQSRCTAVAAGIVAARRAGITDHDAVVAQVLSTLVEYDISPSQPFLAGSSAPDLVTAW